MANENVIINEIGALVRSIKRGDTKIADHTNDDAVKTLIAGRIYPLLAPGAPVPMNIAAASKTDAAAKEALEIAGRTAHIVIREHRKAQGGRA